MSDFRTIVTAAAGLPLTATDDQIATALADMIRPRVEHRQLTEPSAKSFGDMVASVMASENISYADAASKVSRERPDLYEQFRFAPEARFDYNDPARLN